MAEENMISEGDDSPEEAPDFDITERTRWIVPRVFTGSFKEEMEELSRHRQPLRIADGLDAEYVKYLESIEQTWTTDRDGQIIGVFLHYFQNVTVSLEEILKKVAPLHHIRAVQLREDLSGNSGNWLTDEGFQALASWKKIEHMRLELNQLTGLAFTKLAKLNTLPRLQHLELNILDETDKVAAALKDCELLNHLCWSDKKNRNIDLTDAGLEHLGKLKQLKYLTISFNKDNCRITGDGMRHLVGLNKLQTLGIEESNIGNIGLKHLSSLSQLEKLWLNEKAITDEGLAYINNLQKLRALSLDNTQITVKGLEYLEALPKLESLYVTDTSLGDESVPILKKMKHLQSLHIYDTKISKSGYKKIKKALPDCNVVFN